MAGGQLTQLVIGPNLIAPPRRVGEPADHEENAHTQRLRSASGLAEGGDDLATVGIEGGLPGIVHQIDGELVDA